MFIITYIIDNRIDFVRCFTKPILKHNLQVLKERHAKILSITDEYGEPINI